MEMNQLQIALNAILAFAFGAVIGYTRIISNRPAGIRTQALICAGSALMSSLSVTLGHNFGITSADPARIMAQIVTGIGFLGGGVIVKNNDRLKGVTTAAMIWFTAGIGMLVGVGYYLPALVAIGLVLVGEVIAKIEFKMGLKTKPYLLTIYKADLPKVAGIKKFLSTDVKLKLVNGKKVAFYFRSSEQTNHNLVMFLNNKKINYAIDRQSSLKESAEVLNNFAK